MKGLISNDNGFAMLESVAFLFVFVVLTVYTIDFFAAIHTGIVNSIAARTYLFETLQHRTNISLLRQGLKDEQSNPDFSKVHFRFHVVTDEEQGPTSSDSSQPAGRTLTQASTDVQRKMTSIILDSKENKTREIYIKTGYGMCLDAYCPVN